MWHSGADVVDMLCLYRWQCAVRGATVLAIFKPPLNCSFTLFEALPQTLELVFLFLCLVIACAVCVEGDGGGSEETGETQAEGLAEGFIQRCEDCG